MSADGAHPVLDAQTESALLRTALDHMDQGIMVVEADLSVTVFSRRAAELLGLPVELSVDPPSFPELLDWMCRLGIIAPGVKMSAINSFILDRVAIPETHVYERGTFDGRWLEVRTTRRPDGGFVRTFTDQSARKRRELEAEAAQAEYQMLFENSVCGIYRTSLDGGQLRANPALVRLNGYDNEEQMLAAVKDLAREWYVDPSRREEFQALMARDGRVTDFVSEVFRHRTGERMWVSENAWAIRDARGEITGYEGTVTDATERKRAEDAISHIARHDSLTGLPNRWLFTERMVGAYLRDEPFALLVLDLDGFKAVNDTHGHPVGDQVLACLAARFQQILRDDDLLARLGGDEFALFLEASDAEHAEDVARRLIEAASRPIRLDSTLVTLGTSVGIAIAQDGSIDPDEMIRHADAALYRAKANGRGVYHLAGPEERRRLSPASAAADARPDRSQS